MKTYYVHPLKSYFTFSLLLAFSFQLFSATYRNYVSHEIINSGNTLRVWIDSDTAFGETALAELRWGSPGSYSYSGIQTGTFDDATVAGANWYVDISLAGVPNVADLQLATRNEFGNDYGFTDFVIMLSALPVDFTLIDTKTTPKGHEIKWVTASETNNQYFEVQRSTDSKQWNTIKRLEGAGTSHQEISYLILDEKPESGRNYYRIKQVDYDESYSFSSIVSAIWRQNTIKVGPIPTADYLHIYNLPSDQPVHDLEIYNSTGQLIHTERNTDGYISIHHLPIGNHILLIKNINNTVVATKRFSIQY